MRLLNPTSKEVFIPGHRVIATISEVDTNQVHNLGSSHDNDQVFVAANVSAASTFSTHNVESDINFDVSPANLSEAERSELLQFLKPS